MLLIKWLSKILTDVYELKISGELVAHIQLNFSLEY